MVQLIDPRYYRAIPLYWRTPNGSGFSLMANRKVMCPAGVYERDGDRLVVSPANCIDCKATDVLGPRWTPREGGSGPKYRQM